MSTAGLHGVLDASWRRARARRADVFTIIPMPVCTLHARGARGRRAAAARDGRGGRRHHESQVREGLALQALREAVVPVRATGRRAQGDFSQMTYGL